MSAPSPLVVATNALGRLVKEEKSYHKELAQQEARLAKKPDQDDENAEYQARQEAKAIEETKLVIVDMQKKVKDAAVRLKAMLNEPGVDPAEEQKAKDALASSGQEV